MVSPRAADCLKKRVVANPAPDAILVDGPTGRPRIWGGELARISARALRGADLRQLRQTQLGTIDAGLYSRWIDEEPMGGSPPGVNASPAPGEWQSFHICFRAPRFKAGKKIENARFVKVVYNAQAVQPDSKWTARRVLIWILRKRR